MSALRPLPPSLAAVAATLLASLAVASSAPDEASRRARVVLESEAAIESLRVPMKELTRSVQNLVLPGARARATFADRVSVVDLATRPAARRDIADLDARDTSWKLAKETERHGASSKLWEPFLRRVDYFEGASFYTVRGSFDANDAGLFRSPSG